VGGAVAPFLLRHALHDAAVGPAARGEEDGRLAVLSLPGFVDVSLVPTDPPNEHQGGKQPTQRQDGHDHPSQHQQRELQPDLRGRTQIA
jgi:hypothetical protein